MKELGIAVMVFLVVAGGAIWGFRAREDAREEADSRPSIAETVFDKVAPIVEPVSEDAAGVGTDTTEKKNSSDQVSPIDNPSTVSVSVLNAGSVGGSAGKMTAFLKENGYAKAVAGNADSSVKGITIYHAEEMKDEGMALQLLLLKQYSNVVAAPAAEAKIPEAKTAPLVVLIGS